MDSLDRRLRALAFLGLLLLFSPLLGALNGGGTLGGLPLLPAYLFAVWAALVAAAWVLERRGRR